MHYIEVDFSQQSELVVSPNSLNQKNSVDNYLDLDSIDTRYYESRSILLRDSILNNTLYRVRKEY